MAHAHEQLAAEITMRYGPKYRERITLRNGQAAELFMFGRQHAENLIRAFGRMSPDSRYMRFMSMRSALTERQVAYLTGTDGYRHVAIAAAMHGPDGCHEAALARFVRIHDEPDAVEAAITVVDAYQRLGLGSLLMERVLEAARERGYRRLRAELLSDNRAAMALLQRGSQQVRVRREGSVILAELDLWSPATHPSHERGEADVRRPPIACVKT